MAQRYRDWGDSRDADKLNQRQQRRAKMREKQLRERRHMKIMLLVAAAVLIGCVGAIFAIARNRDSMAPEGTAPAQTTEATRPAGPEEETTVPRHNPITTIHIRAAGDLNITDEVVESGLWKNGYDYTRAFIDVAPVLSDADLTVLNFEGNICGMPYGSETRSAPPEILTGLLNAGVDVIQTANSYSIYNGLIGLDQTLNAVRNSGLVPLGSYRTPEEFRQSRGYLICDIQGVKVALVAFTKGVGGMGMPAGNEECVNLLYKDYDSTYKEIDTEGVTRILRAAASEKPDITVAMLHWGSEYNDAISKTQEDIITLLNKEGVDVILGSHPHTLQQVKFDRNAGKLVAYSLGDFFGDADRGGTNYSVVLDVEITKDSSAGTTKVTDFSYTPIYTLSDVECEESSGITRRVVRIRSAMEARDENFVDRITREAYDKMNHALGRIGDRISGKDQKPDEDEQK